MDLHPALEERLARLAPDQRSAATAPPGPLLCVAPAGSGKTATLVARIAWLIGGPERVDPASICAVTFNRRAAEELRERLGAALGPLDVDGAAVRVRTFHALGRELLSEAGVDVSGLVDRSALFAELWPKAPAAALRRLDDAFSRAKLDRQGLEPPIAGALAEYESALRERGALDFDDLVVRALDLLGGAPDTLARWRRRCAHLLVDEVQDVDRTQLDLTVLLAGPERRIFLVGDDDQTIYAWRLADVRRVISLASRLPGLRRVDLTVNYRCPAPVVRRAVRLVEHNRERFRKRIAPRPGAEGSLLLAPLPADEATRARRVLGAWVAAGLPRDEPAPADGRDASPARDERQSIPGPSDGRAAVRDPGGARWAVLARTNAELAPYAAVAVEMGIAFSAEEHRLLLEDPGLDAVLAAAEAEAGGGAEPLAAIGRLRIRAADPGERGARAGESDASTGASTASAGGPGGPSTDQLIGCLLAWAARYETLGELRVALAEARARLARLHREHAPLVLATVHGTKGLEFEHVVVVGLDEGRFPSRRSLEESDDPGRSLEEERRLCYVAWTRARRTLTLLYDPGAPSPFLREAFSEAELLGASRAPVRGRIDSLS